MSYAECHYAECHYAIMLSVIYVECSKQAHCAECRYAVCRYDECLGAIKSVVIVSHELYLFVEPN